MFYRTSIEQVPIDLRHHVNVICDDLSIQKNVSDSDTYDSGKPPYAMVNRYNISNPYDKRFNNERVRLNAVDGVDREGLFRHRIDSLMKSMGARYTICYDDCYFVHSVILPTKHVPSNSQKTVSIAVFNLEELIIDEMLPRILLELLFLVIYCTLLLFLKRISQKSKDLLKLKKIFVRNITLELQTPLTTISDKLEVLIKHGYCNDDSMNLNHLNLLSAEVQKLDRIIDRIHVNSNLERGTENFEYTTIRLSEIIEGAVSYLNDSVIKTRTNLMNLIPNDSYIFGDLEHLNRAFIHLIDYAINYSPKNPELTISAEKVGSMVVVCLSNNGIGIPSKYIKQIFAPYFRAIKTNRNQHKDKGFGMSYVKEVINLHKGKISVHSEEGKGTTFIIQIPMGYAP